MCRAAREAIGRGGLPMTLSTAARCGGGAKSPPRPAARIQAQVARPNVFEEKQRMREGHYANQRLEGLHFFRSDLRADPSLSRGSLFPYRFSRNPSKMWPSSTSAALLSLRRRSSLA